ncbi:MAG: hypothetical protein DMG63_09925 [Acidobacteria bacterium]|nr:MAG: hypothetical protein DMG63_09925 [Acidobacteriota bacterium]
MPKTGEHVQRAAQNLEFAQHFDLKTSLYIDWAVAAYFYAALHLVDALLFEVDGIDPGNHEFRWNFVKNKLYLRGIKNEYWVLKQKSENARYDLITFTSTKLENEVIPRYRSIEQHILQQLPSALVGSYRWLTRPKAAP